MNAIYDLNYHNSMKKILFRKLLFDCLIFFSVTLISTSVIIWVFQAVNFLDIMVEDGRDYLVYINYSLLNFPKIITRIFPFALFFSIFYVTAKYETNNELIIDEKLPIIGTSSVMQNVFKNIAKITKTNLSNSPVSRTKLQQLDFWESFRDYVRSKDSAINLRTPSPKHWYDVSIGTSAAHIALTVNTKNNLMACELYINKELKLM